MIDMKVQSAPIVLDKDSPIKELNIYLKLAFARLEVQKRCTKKSGYNKFADYYSSVVGDNMSSNVKE